MIKIIDEIIAEIKPSNKLVNKYGFCINFFVAPTNCIIFKLSFSE